MSKDGLQICSPPDNYMSKDGLLCLMDAIAYAAPFHPRVELKMYKDAPAEAVVSPLYMRICNNPIGRGNLDKIKAEYGLYLDKVGSHIALGSCRL